VDWNTVVNQNRRQVWRTVYRLLGNDADAADCFQETFISALKVAQRQVVRNWPAMLHCLATTRALDRLRQRMRQKERFETIPQWSAVNSNQPEPAQYAQAAELNDRLRQALTKLPEKQARVFCLRFLDDLSYRQIARQLNLKTDAVGVLLQRARAKLRDLLATELTPNEL